MFALPYVDDVACINVVCVFLLIRGCRCHCSDVMVMTPI